jgi:hypothetical protein
MESRVRGGVQIARVGSPLRVDIEHHETVETTVFGDSCDCCHRWVAIVEGLRPTHTRGWAHLVPSGALPCLSCQDLACISTSTRPGGINGRPGP